jgi:hypothetical protein
MCFIGAITIAGSLMLSYEHAAEVLNFGAFLAFMGVNAAVIRTFWGKRKTEQHGILLDRAAPAAGLLFCLVIWCNLPALAKWIGGCWLAIGLLYQVIQTRGFTRKPVFINFAEEASSD